VIEDGSKDAAADIVKALLTGWMLNTLLKQTKGRALPVTMVLSALKAIIL